MVTFIDRGGQNGLKYADIILARTLTTLLSCLSVGGPTQVIMKGIKEKSILFVKFSTNGEINKLFKGN